EVGFRDHQTAGGAPNKDRGEHGCSGGGTLAVPGSDHAEEFRMICGRELSRRHQEVRTEPLIGFLDLWPEVEVDRARRSLVLAGATTPEGPWAPASSAVAVAIAVPAAIAAGAVRATAATAATLGVGLATLCLELLQCVVDAAHRGFPGVIRARSSARDLDQE